MSLIVWSLPVYEIGDNAAHGVRFSANDQFSVLALNMYKRLLISFAPYGNGSFCTLVYPTTENFYVYSLAVISNNDNIDSELYGFFLVGEYTKTQDIELFYLVFDAAVCGENANAKSYFKMTNTHQEYMFLKVTSSQNFLFIFADTFVLEFDVNDETIEHINMDTLISESVFRPHSVDIMDSYAILVGFIVDSSFTHLSYHQIILVTLDSLEVVTSKSIDDDIAHPIAQIFSYNRANDLSVSINPIREMAIIGLPLINKVILINITTTNLSYDEWALNITNTYVSPQHCTGFGRSVAWIDDRTVAITVLGVPNRPWSQSEVWIFNVDQPFNIPIFIYPNSQQKITILPPPLILQILSWSGNLFIFIDRPDYPLLLPEQPAGFSSVLDKDNIYGYSSIACPPGTYKNISGFGPCTICPPQTKNSGIKPCSKCEPCANNSFCPLGAVGDVSLNVYPSYTQTFSYPSTPDMNNYDDLLVQNIFTIGHTRRCIVISPIFWTIIVITLCFIIWLLMALPKLCGCTTVDYRRKRAKEFFKKIDIVNEGERWIGGLFSFAIVVLFGFTFWFSSEFLKLYPIETSDVSYTSCDNTVRNALFDSGLQLPLPHPDGNQWVIFKMLDTQPFTMTVDLLNTAVNCSNITVQQNRAGINYLRLTIRSCELQPDNVTRSVSFLLPNHHSSIQINITGSFFIGGIRLCLHGPGQINGVNILQTLDICQLFWTINETLSYMTTLQIVLIKVINLTKPLKIGDNTHYNGRWAPTFTASSLSDELLYEQEGQYLRYSVERTTVEITLSEQPFYLQNIQQPIVRSAELSFHTLLFCTLIIELFAMAFLIFRLIIAPIIRLVFRCHHCKRWNDNIENSRLSQSISVLPTNHITLNINDMNIHSSISTEQNNLEHLSFP